MTDRGALDIARAEHTRIYEAIAAGDADLARAATLLHIAQNETWLREHLGACRRRAAARRPLIVDAHQHFWDPAPADYRVPDGRARSDPQGLRA